ncbi:dimerization domain protein, hAT family [Cooperia oncophora]
MIDAHRNKSENVDNQFLKDYTLLKSATAITKHSTKCDLPTVRPADRGYPIYTDEDGNVDKSRRKDAILLSMYNLQKYCPLIETGTLSETRIHFYNFYDSIAEKVRALDEWPNDLRKDKNSIRFYQALLNNSDALKIPLLSAIKCVLVIPASNADPERSFSAATRLTQSDRNSLGTKSIDALMRWVPLSRQKISDIIFLQRYLFISIQLRFCRVQA